MMRGVVPVSLSAGVLGAAAVDALNEHRIVTAALRMVFALMMVSHAWRIA